MVDEHLLTLIHEWEAEIDRLKQLIDEAIAEHEYLSAYYHAEAIELCHDKICLLINLAGKHYSEIYRVTFSLQRTRDLIKNAFSAEERNFYLESLKEREYKLLKLAAQAQRSKKAESSNIIRKYLELLSSRKIGGINLVFNRDKSLLIKVRAGKEGFNLSIPKKAFTDLYSDEIDGYDNRNSNSDAEIRELHSLGFVSGNDSPDYTLQIKKSRKEANDYTMRCLSIICIEVLNNLIPSHQPAELEIV
ncbi:MAG: hypothetical protein HOP30_00120 [Cyclobacteriaceae bacterium]|nr:hypothetical protein [Cyclobacteriaceae bacterium]